MYFCDICHQSFSRGFNLRRHKNTVHPAGTISGFQCIQCNKCFTTKYSLTRHLKTCKVTIQPSNSACTQTGGMRAQASHNHENNEEDVNVPQISNRSLKITLKKNWSAIKTYFKCRKVQDIFNFRLINQKSDIKKVLTNIWMNKLQNQVKMNCSLGFVLQHRITQELRYFHSSINNTQIFDSPVRIKSISDLLSSLDEILELDLFEKAKLSRPDSSWGVLQVTNISFYFSKTDFPKIGAPCNIPYYIRKLKCVHTVISSRGKPFNDNLCFFRCLYLKLVCKHSKTCSCIHKSNPMTYQLLNKYATAINSDTNPDTFTGVTLHDIPLLEKIFDIRVTVYTLDKVSKATIVHQSFSKSKVHLDLCLVNNHFCYISDVSQFTKCFCCQTCSQAFRTKYNLLRHKTSCAKSQSKLKFGNGIFHPPKNIFEKIESMTGLIVPNEYRFYPYRATFDIESYLPKSSDENTPKLSFNTDHILMSISICSNIPEYDTPFCMISKGDTNELVEKFVVYLNHLSKVASTILLAKVEPFLSQLRKIRDDRSSAEAKFKDKPWSNKHVYDSKGWDNIIDQVIAYFQELPVISFNGQRYDINVIRAPLIRHLSKHDEILFAIKRNNTMKCIKTKLLKFLDITNYIAPGFSYSAFIKAYDCKMEKAVFPYEYFDSLQKLSETQLPPHSAFYSTLRQENISIEDYENCCQVWKQNNMKTLRDYLIYYNNLDVLPFLEAIEKQHSIYRDKGIDMFKDGVSVPGLANKWLFKESDTNTFSIPLITKRNSDLHQTIRDNLVGGPSLVFHRFHEKDNTYIKQAIYGSEALKCERILGYDANALYLHSAMQDLPTGTMVRRRKEDDFRPLFIDYFGRMAYEWLEYMSIRSKIQISHKYNHGEIFLGQHNLPVDGFHKESNTVFQFHGCVFHGCQKSDCSKTKGYSINPINGKNYSELYQDTKEKEDYFRCLGYNVLSIFECEWEFVKSNSESVGKFVETLNKREMIERKSMTEKEIIEAIRNDKFFGFVECDIAVPTHLMSKFHEMPPIFKNVNISRDNLSQHMRCFAEENGMLKTPQRSLIGSMFGKKILLLTSLLQWYIKHGLEISKIYQIVQFKRSKCFLRFGEEVCDARREGDVDPSKKIIGETSKLSGNVIYGVTITNKEKFTNLKFTSSPKKASQYVNSNRFIGIEELADDVFEIQLAKTKIDVNTPISVGFAILQYAKLRMLQFKYDLMDKYFDDRSFQYVTMDTDSAYFATSGPLEQILKPELKQSFYNEYDQWFVPPFCAQHKSLFIHHKVTGSEWKMNECCKKAYSYHKRTPGLFKEEYVGTGIVALNAKTYHCYSEISSKTSTKGIMKRLNNYQKTQFLNTLQSKVPTYGTNRGIMRRNQKMVTYSQVRSGLNYFYAKRKVHSDGVTTSPIDL